MTTDNRQEVLSNLQFARSIIEAYPEAKLRLDAFKQETRCGTLFCGLGLLASIPKFKAQGLVLSDDGTKTNNGTYYDVFVRDMNGQLHSPFASYDQEYLNNIFGDDAYSMLFDISRCSPLDEDWTGVDASERAEVERIDITDKDRLLKRFDLRIAEYQNLVQEVVS